MPIYLTREGRERTRAREAKDAASRREADRAAFLARTRDLGEQLGRIASEQSLAAAADRYEAIRTAAMAPFASAAARPPSSSSPPDGTPMDTSKMSGVELINYGLEQNQKRREQQAEASQPPPPTPDDLSSMTAGELMLLGLAQSRPARPSAGQGK